MTRFFRLDGTSIILSGDTFAIKETIKNLGGRWDGRQKSWILIHEPTNVEKLLILGFQQQDSIAFESVVDVSLENKIWSVQEFLGFATHVVNKYLGSSIWLAGEITSLKSSNGHIYFELADPAEENTLASADSTGWNNKQLRTSSINCCLWAGKLKGLETKYGKLPLQDGIKLKVNVHCELKKEGARLNVIVDDIDINYTLGDLALARKKTVDELRKRGLYDRQRQLGIPALPLRIALITAAGSRAITDFLDELKQSGISFLLDVFDCNMQGEQTSPNVTSALSQIAELQIYDCTVITRGGGSRLDLRWFDDFEICKAIAHSPIPVITAIGHFEDVSIADEVCFRAEKTPTGAARYLVNQVLEAYEKIMEASSQLGRMATKRVSKEQELLSRVADSLALSARRKITLEKSKVDSSEQTIQVLKASLSKILKRGFAIARSPEGQPLLAKDFIQNPQQKFILEMTGDNLKPVRVSAVSTEVNES